MASGEDTPEPSGRDVRSDGGNDEREDDDHVREPGSGILSRVFPRLDVRISALERELARTSEQRGELETRLEGLEAALGERDVGVETLLERFGQSLARANADLRGSGVAVGDLDVSLRVDVTGSRDDGGVALRLVDPAEEVDPGRLSTISFTVGRRGQLRHYGPRGAAVAGTGKPGVSRGDRVSTPTVGASEGIDRVEAEEPTERPATPVEVPNVEGLSVGDAKAELEGEGFEPLVKHRPMATPVGTVVEQWPGPLAVTTLGATVVLFVGGDDGSASTTEEHTENGGPTDAEDERELPDDAEDADEEREE
jgi:hypothetical protein